MSNKIANIHSKIPLAQPSQLGIDALRHAVWWPDMARVAVIGASKNAGKTTTLNTLHAAGVQQGWRMGLVSVGVDGEAVDAWMDIAKPQVAVERGTLVVTADAVVRAANGFLRPIAQNDFGSALGPTLIAEARGPGGAQLCGVPHRGHLRSAIALLQQCGAQRVLIDGAYHRQAAAHPDIADGLVLAVGAVLGDTPQQVVDRASLTLLALLTPQVTDPIAHPIQGALSDDLIDQLPKHTAFIVVKTQGHVLLTTLGRQVLQRRNIAIVAQKALPLLAITTNPYHPGGVDLDAVAMQHTLRDFVAAHCETAIPIIDVVTGAVLLSRQGD